MITECEKASNCYAASHPTGEGVKTPHPVCFANHLPSRGRLIYLPVAQLDSASDSAFRHRRNIARRGDGTLDRTAPCDYHNLHPERQTLKVFRKNTSSVFCFAKATFPSRGRLIYLPVAQPDSASDSDSEGPRFESAQVGQKSRFYGRDFSIDTIYDMCYN